MEPWEIIKYAGNAILAGLLGFIAFFGKSQLKRIEELEKKQLGLELSHTEKFAVMGKEIAVLKSQVDDIKMDIKEIKDGINKILDRLL